MKALRSIAAGLMLSGLSGLTLAAGNPLSVHVLNLENGLPSPDVRVTLEQRQGDTWKSLNSGETNAQGRITALYPEGKALEKAPIASPSRPATGSPRRRPAPFPRSSGDL